MELSPARHFVPNHSRPQISSLSLTWLHKRSVTRETPNLIEACPYTSYLIHYSISQSNYFPMFPSPESENIPCDRAKGSDEIWAQE